MTIKNQTTDGTTDGLKVEESPELKIVYVTTPKRRERIKIHVPRGQFPYWEICYENGVPIEGLKGKWMSRLDAIKSVVAWERKAKKTDGAKKQELFGDKEPPVLKRKPIRGSRAQTNAG